MGNIFTNVREDEDDDDIKTQLSNNFCKNIQRLITQGTGDDIDRYFQAIENADKCAIVSIIDFSHVESREKSAL